MKRNPGQNPALRQKKVFFLFLMQLFAICLSVYAEKINYAEDPLVQQRFVSKKDKEGLYEWTGSFVVDAGHILSADQFTSLTTYLTKLNDSTGIQIALLTLPSTNGEAIHDLAVRHFEKWKLGRKGIDDGVLLTIAVRDRSMDITTGYGAEERLTDILCKKIIDDLMVPLFREGKMGQGSILAIKTIAGIVNPESSEKVTKDLISGNIRPQTESLSPLLSENSAISSVAAENSEKLAEAEYKESNEEEPDSEKKDKKENTALETIIWIIIAIIVWLFNRKLGLWGGSSGGHSGGHSGGSSSYRSGGGGSTGGGGSSGKW